MARFFKFQSRLKFGDLPSLTERGEKSQTPKISALLRERPVLLRANNFLNSSLLRTENGLATDIFVVKDAGRGLVVKRRGVLSKDQMLNLVLGVGVFPFFQFLHLDGQNRQSPIASDFGSRTPIASLFAVLLYWSV